MPGAPRDAGDSRGDQERAGLSPVGGDISPGESGKNNFRGFLGSEKCYEYIVIGLESEDTLRRLTLE